MNFLDRLKNYKTNRVKHVYDFLPQNIADKQIELCKNKSYNLHKSKITSKYYFFASYLNTSEEEIYLPYLLPLLELYCKENNLSSDYYLKTAYINCHPSFHGGDWHIDNTDGVSIVYYPATHINYLNSGGIEITGYGEYPYINNSALIFSSNILHRAKYHTIEGNLRFSFAFKFTKK